MIFSKQLMIDLLDYLQMKYLVVWCQKKAVD